MKRAGLLALVVLGAVLLLGAMPPKRFPYVSRALNQTRTITELEYRILENRVDTTPVPVPGGAFHIRKMDARPQPYALLVKVDVALNTGQKPLVWSAKVLDRRVSAAARSLYPLARARFGDNASFPRGVGGLLVVVTMNGKPLIYTGTGEGTHRFAPDDSPADVAEAISKRIERFRVKMGG